MTLLLVRNIHTLVTMDAARREIPDGALLVADNVIEAVGTTADILDMLERSGRTPDETLDLSGHIVLPGFVNTHHHMSQSLMRALPTMQDQSLYPWIAAMCAYTPRLNPEMIYVSALTAMAELVLSGCTTSSDHLYIYPNGARMDDEIRAAHEIGMRFHPCRGSISQNGGKLLPDEVIETEPGIERDTIRLIDTYHDSSRYAMLRIVVAPGAPGSVTHGFMRDCARLARSYGDRGVRLHTHFVEVAEDVAFLHAETGLTPEGYLQEYEWAGDDVWHAHCVHLSDAGIDLFARTGTGVAHCPHSNMRLGAGIAPIVKMRRAGVRVALGVDGSASNDGGHMVSEARQALMLARAANHDAAALTAREAIELATLGGAAVLGRDDIGSLASGMAADFFAVNLNRLTFAGGLHDPVAALILCTSVNADYTLINGRFVVRGGEVVGLDMGRHIELHNACAKALAGG
jgi:cytosine/adenosine deaminase-related metal-dependent hydrolase